MSSANRIAAAAGCARNRHPYASHGRQFADPWKDGSSDVKRRKGSHTVHTEECTLARHQDSSKSVRQIAGGDG